MSSNVSPPPFYDDLGRSAKELFSKGYYDNTLALDMKFKAATIGNSCFGFSSFKLDSKKGVGIGTSQTAMGFPKVGLSITKTWKATNTHSAEVKCDGVGVFKGAALTVDHTTDDDLKVKMAYKNNRLALNTDLDFLKSARPQLISGSGVFQFCDGGIIGLKSKFDMNDFKLKNTNFAVGYNTKEYVFNLNMSDENSYSSHIYRKVNPFLETGVELEWSSINTDTKFGFGCKYAWTNRDTTVRAKVNSSNQIGLSLTGKLIDGVTITSSALINCQNFNQGGYKFGAGIELEV
ncbi:voltage-dependent anion-selective channel-like [Planococcus citri]|uniref:voltage-dependent anion-selective channel-like n=1 Tax=Planococcus citri TaxID=170843 RepID=UPI0031F96683